MAKVLVTLSDELLQRLDTLVGRGSRSAVIEEAVWALLKQETSIAPARSRYGAPSAKTVALAKSGKIPGAILPYDPVTGDPIEPPKFGSRLKKKP